MCRHHGSESFPVHCSLVINSHHEQFIKYDICVGGTSCMIKKHWGREKVAGIFPDEIFKSIFMNENAYISNKSSYKFVPKGPINNISALMQIMAKLTNRQKAISWSKGHPIRWRIYAALWGDELLSHTVYFFYFVVITLNVSASVDRGSIMSTLHRVFMIVYGSL